VRKGAVWWFSTRERDGMVETTLKAVVNPDMVESNFHHEAHSRAARRLRREGYLLPVAVTPEEIRPSPTKCRACSASIPRERPREGQRRGATNFAAPFTASPSRSSRAIRAWSIR